MTTPLEAMDKLTALADELGNLSSMLAQVERDLEPVDRDYVAFTDMHDIGLYERSVSEDGFKLPSAEMRLKLANRAMAPELYGRRTALVKSRERIIKRISDLKSQIEAQRSILSALKLEAEATGGRR